MTPQNTNEKSLNRLIRAILLSSGEFSLTLACANYPGLRDRIIKQIEALPENVPEIRLPANAENIYDVIREAIGDGVPDGLMVTGLESLRNPDAAFASMNQLREEFRGLPFPVVLWGIDPVLERFARIAPDFRTWAGSAIRFEPEESELLTALRHNAAHIIASAMGIGGGGGIKELDAFLTSFEADMAGGDLEASDIAELNLLKGARSFHEGDMEAALGFYRSAFSYWEKTADADRRGAMSRLIGRCLEKNRDLDGAEACYGACVTGFSAHESLRESCVRDLCRVLREAGDRWDELERRANEAGQADYNALAVAVRGAEPARTVIDHLEAARELGPREDDTQLFIDILDRLHGLYFSEKAYGKAFEVKQERLSIEQQLGFRAFVGPGRVRARYRFLADETDVAREIRASGRQKDVDALMERLSRTDCRLIVLHGPSGVGKSSLIEAGLVPTIKKKRILQRRVLPVLIRDYSDWADQVRTQFSRYDSKLNVRNNSGNNATDILYMLREKLAGRRLSLLIFDQFESFFFTNSLLRERQLFYNFFHDALNASYVKSIICIREDYLHRLLECDKLANLRVINHNILDRNIRYSLENLSSTSAKEVIKRITYGGPFRLEAELINRIVRDLMTEDNSVRPIELQIIGSQLQDNNINTLREYQKLGHGDAQNPESALVSGFMEQAVKDCGIENEDAAHVLLCLLTDKNGTRLSKSRSELTTESKSLGIDFSESQMELVLNVLKNSGIIEKPSKFYQITHDYLAEQVRQTSKQIFQKIDKQRREIEVKHQIEKKEAMRLEEEAKLFFENGLSGHNPLDFQKCWLLTLSALNIDIGEKNRPFCLGHLATPELRQYLFPHHWKCINKKACLSSVFSLSFSPDGKAIAFGSSDKTIRVWDAVTMSEINVLTGHLASIYCISFSLDGKTLASGSEDNTVRLWYTLSGNKHMILYGHTAPVRCVSFCTTGKTVASASEDHTIRLWEVSTGNELAIFEGHSDSVLSISFSPDGKTLASGACDKTIRFWDIPNKKQSVKFKGHGSTLRNLIFHKDGQILASCSDDNVIKFWDIIKNNEIRLLEGHTGRINSLTFSPNGEFLASCSDDKSIRLWEVDSGKEVGILEGHSCPIKDISFSPNGESIASVSTNNNIRIWKISTIDPSLIFFEHSSLVLSVSFSPDGKIVASGSYGNKIHLWELATGKELAAFEGHSGPVFCVSFEPHGKTIASCSLDSTVRLWDIDTGKELAICRGHSSLIWKVSFSPDGKTIATVSNDNTLKLWDASTGKEISSFNNYSSSVKSLAFSPNGKTVAAGFSGNYEICLLDIFSGRQFTVFKGHSAPVSSIAFSPNGKNLVSGSEDETVRLWEVATGYELSTFKGHSGYISSVKFSPDGRMIASGSHDNTIRLWEYNSVGELAVLRGHASSVSSVAFSPDGKIIASGSSDKTVRLYKIELIVDYLEYGASSPLFQKIREKSFQLIPHKIEGTKFTEIHRRFFPVKNSVNRQGYFPSHRDAIEWMIETFDRMEPEEEPSN